MGELISSLEKMAEAKDKENAKVRAKEEADKKAKYDDLRWKVETLVRKAIPDEVGNIDVMLKEYAGNEDELISSLEKMAEVKDKENAKVRAKEEAEKKAKHEDLRWKVETLVRKAIPDEVGNIDVMLKEFAGNEEELISSLEKM